VDARSKPSPTLVPVLLLTTVALLTPLATSSAAAAPLRAKEARLSIASPAAGTLVGGLIPVTVAFDAGAVGKVTRLELWVDDLFYSTAPVEGTPARGTYSLDLDTGRLRNGQHTLQIRCFSGRRAVAIDQAVVTVSNGGADIVPPLVSFFAPLEGETLSGTATIGVNATDNDQVALVGISVNRMPVLIKSNPPFTYQLDTTTLPLPDGTGTILLEAMAIDRANNIGKATPIRVRVSNPVNATPLQADPPDKAPSPRRSTTNEQRPAAVVPKAGAPIAAAPKVTPLPRSVTTPQRRIAPPVSRPAPATTRMASLPKSLAALLPPSAALAAPRATAPKVEPRRSTNAQRRPRVPWATPRRAR
jgi:hypothetical protein